MFRCNPRSPPPCHHRLFAANTRRLVTLVFVCIQVEVAEGEFHKLRKFITNATDFESIRQVGVCGCIVAHDRSPQLQAHGNYILAMVSKCYLNASRVRGAIERVLRSCLQFCSMVGR